MRDSWDFVYIKGGKVIFLFFNVMFRNYNICRNIIFRLVNNIEVNYSIIFVFKKREDKIVL